MKDLISELKTNLGTIGGIQEVYMHRDANPTKYPAIVCNWDSVDNSFETNQENKRSVDFRLFIIVNVAGKSMESIDEVVIPNIYDKVSDYFDTNWNQNLKAGHRVWSRLSLASSRISVENKSKLAYIDCILTIQYLKNN